MDGPTYLRKITLATVAKNRMSSAKGENTGRSGGCRNNLDERDGKKGSDSVCVMKHERTRFTDDLDMKL